MELILAMKGQLDIRKPNQFNTLTEYVVKKNMIILIDGEKVFIKIIVIYDKRSQKTEKTSDINQDKNNEHLINDNGAENGNPLQYSGLENSMDRAPGGCSTWGH